MGGVKTLKRLNQLDVLHSSSDGTHVLLSVSPQSKFIVSFLDPRQCGGRVWKHGQQSHSFHQTSSPPVFVLKYASSVSDLSRLRKLGHSPDKELHTQPFLLFSWYWVFHLHQHLSHCSEGFEDSLQLGGTYAFAGFFNLLWHPFTYGRHKTCTLLLHHLFILLVSLIFVLIERTIQQS